MPMTYGEWKKEQDEVMLSELENYRAHMKQTSKRLGEAREEFAEKIIQRYPVLQDGRPVRLVATHIKFLDEITAGKQTGVLKYKELVGTRKVETFA